MAAFVTREGGQDTVIEFEKQPFNHHRSDGHNK